MPSNVAKLAQLLITQLLQIDPKKRPKIEETTQHEWFSGFTPTSLPASVLVSAPRFNNVEEDKVMKVSHLIRKPLKEVNNGNTLMSAGKMKTLLRSLHI